MRLLVALLALVAAVLPTVASAHPLGNFTVNHYARIEPAGSQVFVHYVLDMAEIPTFQEKSAMDPDPAAYADRRAAEIGANLHLTLNGSSVPLAVSQRTLSLPEGQGGLPTLRLEVTYAADLATDRSSPVELTFRDDNDPTHIGWREIVARPGEAGTVLSSSSVPSQDVTNELRVYPEDLLSSPLDVRSAHVAFVPGAASAQPAPALQVPLSVPAAGTMMPLFAFGGTSLLDRTRSTFAELANGSELTLGFVLFAVGVAIVLGAAHALQPGHGKTVVAAYLVGSRGTAMHALFLGATVTATHTAGVYALGLVTLGLSQYIVPERLYPILEAASGVLVLAIGGWLLGTRVLSALGGWRHSGTHDDHPHEHAAHAHASEALSAHGGDHSHTSEHHSHEHADHAHPSEALSAHGGEPSHTLEHHPHAEGLHSHGPGQKPHSHVPPSGKVGLKALLVLGISGGLLPCPEALMVLLITIAAHRVLFGLLLIVAFSTGLAGVLVGFGLLLVFARGFFSRINLSSGLAPRLLPIASALVIVVAGGVITAQALPQVL